MSPEAATILDGPEPEAPTTKQVNLADHEDPIIQEYHRLKMQLANAINHRDFWNSVFLSPVMKSWLAARRAELDLPVLTAMAENNIKTKDLPEFVNELRAKEWFLHEFEQLRDADEVSALRHAITHYENENSLFLQGESRSLKSFSQPTQEPEPTQEEIDQAVAELGEDGCIAEDLQDEPVGKQYITIDTKLGTRRLFVSEIEPNEWATACRNEAGEVSRFVARSLRVRDTQEDAQHDLDQYAINGGLSEAE